MVKCGEAKRRGGVDSSSARFFLPLPLPAPKPTIQHDRACRHVVFVLFGFSLCANCCARSARLVFAR